MGQNFSVINNKWYFNFICPLENIFQTVLMLFFCTLKTLAGAKYVDT